MPRIQLVFDGTPPDLDADRIEKAINSTATPYGKTVKALVRLVSLAEMAHLLRFKGSDGPTNVLTFTHMTGADIAICPQVAEEDAAVRGWDLHSELNYLCIHGCLHALGFDHEDRASATEMERLERQILANLGQDSSALDP